MSKPEIKRISKDEVRIDCIRDRNPRKDPREWECDYCGAKCRDKVCACGEVRPG
jgi:hypothetical protein